MMAKGCQRPSVDSLVLCQPGSPLPFRKRTSHVAKIYLPFTVANNTNEWDF